MGKFKPRELRNDASPDELRRQLNEIQKELAQDLAALAAASPITPLQTSGYTARYGDIVRVAPPAGGLRVILPPVNRAQPNGRVSVIVEGTAGALSVEAVDATVNGADTVTFAAGEGLIEFRLTDTGWYGWSLDLLEQPIPAKSVWANATNGLALPAALAGTGAFQYLRVNSTNTGLEMAVLSLASFPTQASDTFLGNVSGSVAVPSAVNLSSLAGTDLGFTAHTFSVTSTWGSVLGRGANSGAHNPIVDASQWLGFGSNPGGVSTGQIRADGDLVIRSNGVASLLGASTTGIASLGDVNILSGVISGDINLSVLGSGRVNVTGGFVDYTGQSSSTPSVASGHGLIWTKTDNPSRLYFTDDANVDNKLAYFSDIASPSIISKARLSEDFTNVADATTTLGNTETVIRCGNTTWTAVATASGSTISAVAGTAGHPGKIILTTVANQGARLYHNRPGWAAGSVANVIVYDDIARVDWVVLPSALATIDFFIGFADVIGLTNAFGFNFDTNVSTTNMTALAHAGGVASTTTATAVATESKYSAILTAGQIQFQVDGVNFGSAITTNLPTGVALTPYARVFARGGTPRSLTIDAFEWQSPTLTR